MSKEEEPLDLEFNPFTKKKEPGYNVKADNRLVERFMPCANCIYKIRIVNPYEPDLETTCKAFPTGIPWPVQEGAWNHDHVFGNQEGTYVYEGEKVASFPDGYNYVTFDGEYYKKEE